jgi:hypothetical protein
MKKANELNRRYGVRVAVIVDDEPALDEWTYQSDESWPPYFKSVSRGKNRYFPGDFITLSEFQRGGVVALLDDSNFAAPSLPTPPSHPARDFEDDNFALLQALGSGYPPIESNETPLSHQATEERVCGYELNKHLKRPPPSTLNHSMKKARKSTWSSNGKPVTRSVVRTGHQDNYNFAG